MNRDDILADLERRAELGGGEDRLARQHAAGKLTARERIDLLFDPGTFEEVDKLVTHRCRDFGMEQQLVPGDGVVAGHGLVMDTETPNMKTLDLAIDAYRHAIEADPTYQTAIDDLARVQARKELLPGK